MPSGSSTPIFADVPLTTVSIIAGSNCGSENTHLAS
ncbi:Uncharacterised protein [Vibrio cholerae]|nr:Uncharacterised protein [Vibrio cholerae]CSC41631.1 Uncharacterised protein [Vibrio cholerae]